MSRIRVVEGLLLNLDQKIAPGRREYLDREAAYQKLKTLTGQDFGYDSKHWREWIKNTKFQHQNAKKPF
jgi:hypothetical protein